MEKVPGTAGTGNLPCAQGKEQQERDEQIYTGKRKTGIHGGKAGKGDPGL
jgi:hypothetical protein